MLLECPRCLKVREGEFSQKNPPGRCVCGARALWRVMKARRPKGYVVVTSSQGWQELQTPHFYENPYGWKPFDFEMEIPK